MKTTITRVRHISSRYQEYDDLTTRDLDAELLVGDLICLHYTFYKVTGRWHDLDQGVMHVEVEEEDER